VAAGFRVEKFTAHFPRSSTMPGKREESVKDPKIIQLCHRKNWLIVTTDSNMRITHVEEIKKHPNVTILSTAHNTHCDMDVWVKALIIAKLDVERKVRKQGRPWYAQFNRQGQITTCRTIDVQTTSRTRPREK
jgi:predicted nuclease of predicted toxin-antitoxin system